MREIKVRKSYEKEGFRGPIFDYRPDWPYISIGFGNEREYFIENLSLLIASGMGIMAALSSIASSVKTRKMKKVTKYIETAVTDGTPLWKAFKQTKLFPDRVISLIRSGEEAGRLPEHLNLVTVQQHKEKVFRSRLKSALLYPGIVLLLAFTVGLGAVWLVLPGLVSIFGESQGVLPLNTQLLIIAAQFFEQYGIIAVPALIIFLMFISYIFFVNQYTKRIGDWILFHLTGINTLVKGVELARFGYIFGALLQAGFQPGESLQALEDGTNYVAYRKFYAHIRKSITQGDSFKTALETYKKSDRFIPLPIQQLIISAEKSGRLPETLIKVGVIFEEKTDAMSQDLATVLEPIILVVVGLIVAFVVSAILGPIYGLSNQIQ